MYSVIWKTSVVVACGLFACNLWAAPGLTPAVRVEKATLLDRSEPKLYVGTVSASEEVDVVARISGELWKVAFKEGSLVKKGDLLFQIEDTIYRENVNVAKATLEQAIAEFDYATKERDRHEQLYKTKATAQTTYEETVRTYMVDKAKVDEAKANLLLAQNDFSYTKIYSPLNGQIGRKTYSEGNYITPEKGSMVTIVQYDPINIDFAMSESDFFKYSKNGTFSDASMEIIRADGKVFKSNLKVDFLDNKVDTSTGTLLIQLIADNPDMFLIPGGYVTVRFNEVYEKPIVAVTVSALMTDGEHHYVYVLGADNKIERRQIVVGAQVSDKQLVLSGLKEGETVVVAGIHKVKPGDVVTPVFSETSAK